MGGAEQDVALPLEGSAAAAKDTHYHTLTQCSLLASWKKSTKSLPVFQIIPSIHVTCLYKVDKKRAKQKEVEE